MYVLTVSMGVNPKSSTMQYPSGTFNGMHFAPADYLTQFVDFSEDSYAVQFFSGTPEGDNTLLLAWAANLQSKSLVPIARAGWRCAMTIPKHMFSTNVSNVPAGLNFVALPVDSSAAFDPSRSAAVEKDWNGSAAVEMNVNGFASSAFHPDQRD